MFGHFITLEGGEGSGKSTQAALLRDALSKAKIDFIQTREPGGSPGAERIRELLVSGAIDAWDATAETLLFYAARVEHVNKIIRPALAAGKTVICDRFLDSTIVYQGIAKGLGATYIESLHRLALGNFMPDLTLLFDIDPTVGLSRASSRNGGEDRFERMGLDFHHQIRAGFLGFSTNDPSRCAVIDASSDAQNVHQQALAVIRQRLQLAV